MNNSHSTIADSVAKAAMAMPPRELGFLPSLVVVVAVADALVVTMCATLPVQNSHLPQTLNSQRFRREHFAQSLGPLRGAIENITDRLVLKSSLDFDETSRSVVYTFTTGDVLSVCLLAEHTQGDDWTDSQIMFQP